MEKTRRAVTLTGAFLSIGLMTNFLSLNDMFLISLQGNPIFGVNLCDSRKDVRPFSSFIIGKVKTSNFRCNDLLLTTAVQSCLPAAQTHRVCLN